MDSNRDSIDRAPSGWPLLRDVIRRVVEHRDAYERRCAEAGAPPPTAYVAGLNDALRILASTAPRARCGWRAILLGRGGALILRAVHVEPCAGGGRALRATVVDYPGAAGVSAEGDDVPGAVFDAVAASRGAWTLVGVCPPEEDAGASPARQGNEREP